MASYVLLPLRKGTIVKVNVGLGVAGIMGKAVWSAYGTGTN